MIANPAYHQQRQARPDRRARHLLLGVLISFFVLLVLANVALLGAWFLLGQGRGAGQDRISPNVYILGANLGGMTASEAADALGRAKGLDSTSIVLRDGGQRWTIPWSEVGVSVDVDATVQVALAIGHSEDSPWARLTASFRRHEVDPILAVDPQVARAALEHLAPQVSVAPVDAVLRLEGDRPVAVPGQPGRALDVDATVPRLITAVMDPAARGQADLAFRTVPPKVADAGPFLAQAEEMLQRRLELSAYDVLADETFTWTLERSTIVGWLRTAKPEDKTPSLTIDPEAVKATLESLAADMGQRRGLRLEEATGQVLKAFEAGDGQVALYLTHPERSYTVQSGDVLDNIALRFGIPTAILAEANPSINPNWLSVGQELVIPSPDVMLPNMPVRGKRIVISIGQQRMRVYENGNQIYDWAVSTGIPSSPTMPGTFQILEKVDNAYASRWSLWMPHFQAIYRAGPDFYNGIHALPINANGMQLWAGLLGRPASFGCIILSVQDAQTLFKWTEVGVPVIIEP